MIWSLFKSYSARLERLLSKLTNKVQEIGNLTMLKNPRVIKEYMEKHFGERITLYNIQNELKTQIGELRLFQIQQFRNCPGPSFITFIRNVPI